MKTDKEDMLKTYNEFKALCLEKGYEFKFDGIQEYVNGKYAVLLWWNPNGKAEDSMEITYAAGDVDVLTATKELYQLGYESLIKYG